jgi:hypothetical protein
LRSTPDLRPNFYSRAQAEVDYEEFKQPDANGDDRITRTEFNAYIADYLRQYPHLRREDMPRFEDFDMTSECASARGQ